MSRFTPLETQRRDRLSPGERERIHIEGLKLDSGFRADKIVHELVVLELVLVLGANSRIRAESKEISQAVDCQLNL